MEVYQGMATCKGIAIGKIHYYHKNEYLIRQYTVENARRELERFGKARRQVEAELKKLFQKLTSELGEQEGRSLKEHIQVLSSGSFSRAIESLIHNERVNASYAVATTRDELVATFAGLEDACVRSRVESIRVVSDRLIGELEQIPKGISLTEEKVILAAEELSPTDIIELDTSKILAVVTRHGSEFSHTSILAKTMNVPALIHLDVKPEWDGRLAVADSYSGRIFLDPDEEIYKEFQGKQQKEQEEQESLLKIRDAKDETLDGYQVELYANINNLEDLPLVLQSGARGIGLLRSEFQYLGRENYPRENELFRAYRKVAQAMNGNPVVIRTADLGGDKQAEYMNLPQEANPLLGNRGIRISLDRKQMFKAQLRAIFRASAYGNLRILYPMITSIEEIYQIQELVAEVKDGLEKKGIPYGYVLQGVMIETPASALICRDIAKEVDFISLGTNDLTQYLLAMDRQNPYLAGKYDNHHPAVFRMIQMVVKECREAGCPVSVCGELAGEQELVPKFLKMGVDMLSVVPVSILPVRKSIRETDLREVKDGWIGN